MSEDIFIGFREKPNDLENFLTGEGYTEIQKERKLTIFLRKDDISTTITYYPEAEVVEEGEVPDWSKSSHKIFSEVVINFPHSSYQDVEEAHRITDKIIDQYKAIRYDQNFDEFTEF